MNEFAPSVQSKTENGKRESQTEFAFQPFQHRIAVYSNGPANSDDQLEWMLWQSGFGVDVRGGAPWADPVSTMRSGLDVGLR